MGITDNENIVGTMTAEIELPVDKFEKELIQTLTNAQATVDGKAIVIKLNGDKAEIEKSIQQIQALEPTVKANIVLDGSELDKQSKAIKKYVGSTRQQIESELSKVGKNLDLSKIVKGELGLAKSAKIEAEQVNQTLNKLKKDVQSVKLHSDDNNITDIERKAESLNKIQTVLREMGNDPSLNTAGLDIAKALETTEKEIDTFTRTGGKRIYDNIADWKEGIDQTVQSVQTFKTNLEDVVSTLAKSHSAQSGTIVNAEQKQVSNIREVNNEYLKATDTVKKLEEQIANLSKNTENRMAQLKKVIKSAYNDVDNPLNFYKSVKEYESLGGSVNDFGKRQAEDYREYLKIIEKTENVKGINFKPATEQLEELNTQLVEAKTNRDKLNASAPVQMKEVSTPIAEGEVEAVKSKLSLITESFKTDINSIFSELNNQLAKVPTAINTEQVVSQIKAVLQTPFTVNLEPKTDTFISTIKERLSKANFSANIKDLSGNGVTANVKVESNEQDFNRLNTAILQVTNSIRTKTEAVVLEEKTVTSSIGKEISGFNRLNEKLIEIKSNLYSISKIKIPAIKLKQAKTNSSKSSTGASTQEEITGKELDRIDAFVVKTKQATEAETERQRVAQNSAINKALAEEFVERQKLNRQIDEINQKRDIESRNLIGQTKNWEITLSKYMRSNKGYNLTADDLIDPTGFNEAKRQVEAVFNEIQNGSVKSKDRLEELKITFARAKEELAGIANENNLLYNNKGELITKGVLDTTKDYETQLRFVMEALTEGAATANSYNNVTQSLNYTVKAGKNGFQDYVLSVDETNKGFRVLATTATQTQSILSKAFSGLGNKLIDVFHYFGSFGTIYKFFSAIKSGYNIVKDIDTQMTELKKVASETIEELNAFEKQSFSIANSIGTTASQVIESTADFERLGYSLKEATELSKNANIYANVGDLDIATSTEHLISIMKAFNLEATQSIDVIDALNEIGNKYAVSSADLGEILERSASALYTAGNSMEETIALGTAMNEVLQDSSQAGAALKVVSLRLRGASTELKDAGEETEGMAESTSKLAEQIQALTNIDGSGGFNILNDDGTFKSTTEMIQGIGAAFEKMDKSSTNAAALIELMFGKNRANAGVALLNQYKKIDEVLTTIENDEGSAQEENDRWMESIQGHLNKLQTAWEECWDNGMLKETIIVFINLGTLILNLINQIGLLKTVMLSIMGVSVLKNTKVLAKGFGAIKQSIELLKNGGLKAQKVMEALFGATKPQVFKDMSEAAEQGAKAIRDLASAEAQETIQAQRSAEATTQDTIATETETVADLKGASANEVEAKTENEQTKADVAHTSAMRENITTAEAETVADMANATANEAEAMSEIASSAAETTGTIASVTSGFGGAIAAVKGFVAAHAMVATVAVGAIAALAAGVIIYQNSLTKAKKDLEKAESSFEQVDNKVKDLNSELESQNELIAELKSKGTLTFIEKEQLQDLQATSAELQSQLATEKEIAKIKAQEAAKAQIKTAEKEFGDLSNLEATAKKRAEWAADSWNVASDSEDVAGLIAQYDNLLKTAQKAKNGDQDVLNYTSVEEAQEALENTDETLTQLLPTLQEYKNSMADYVQYLDKSNLSPNEQEILDYYNALSNTIDSIRKRTQTSEWNTEQYDKLIASLDEADLQKIDELFKAGKLNSSAIQQIDSLTEGINNLDFALEEGKTKAEMFFEQFAASSDFGKAISLLQGAGLSESLARELANSLDSTQITSLISGGFNEALNKAFVKTSNEADSTLFAIKNLINEYNKAQKELGGNPNLNANPYFEQMSALADTTGTSVEKLQDIFGQSKDKIAENVELVEQYYSALESDEPVSESLWNSIVQGAKDAELSVGEYLSVYSSDVMDEAIVSLSEIKSELYEIMGLTSAGKTTTTVADLLGLSVGDGDDTFSDKIDEIQSQIETLEETRNSLKTNLNGLSANEKIDLIQEFPELTPYINDSDLLLDKLQEVEQQKLQGVIDELKNFDGATQEDIEALEIFKEELNSLNFTNPLDFSNTATQLSSITSELSSLSSALQTLEEGTVLTKGQMVELAMEYPKLIEQENLFTDTTVDGQQEMLQSIVDMHEQQYDAIIDEKIAELEASKQVVDSSISLEEQKLTILQDLYTAYKNGELQTEEDFNEYLNQLHDLEGQNFVAYKDGELTVTKDALDKQLEMQDEHGIKSESIWQEQEMTISGAFSNGAGSALTSLNKLGSGISDFATKAKLIFSGVKNIISAVFDPNKSISEAWSSAWSGIDTSGGGESSAKTDYSSQNVTIGNKSVKGFVANYSETINKRINELKGLKGKYTTEIENLKKLKGLDLGTILKTSGNSNSGGSGGKDSKESEFSEQIDWAANSIENLTRQLERLQKVLDNTTSAKKQTSTLKKMINIQKKLVKANQASASTYEAVYKLALQDIPKKYRAKYKKLIESDATFKYQSFEGKSDGSQEKLYDAVTAAQEMYKTWQDAKDATTEAKEQLKEYAEQLAAVPWEAAQKKVEKLNTKLELLDAKLANAKNYKEKNKILEQQLKLQEKIVNAQKTASEQNEETLDSDRKALKKNLDAQEKAILKSINKKYKQKSDYNIDGTLKVDKKASKEQKALIKKYNNLVKKENAISTTETVVTGTSSKEVDNTSSQAYKDAKANLKNEFSKLAEWGLGEYKKALNSKYVKGKDTFVQTVFGNVDMDKRTIITWSNKLKKTYKDALESWDYNPENGSIDTVFGGSARFGESLNVNNHKGYEIAFSPILQTEDGAKLLDKDTVTEYIEGVLKKAAKDGKVTKEEILKIDAEGIGKKAGEDIIKGLIAEIDAGTDYGNNGLNNKAVEAAMLMHFSGNYGAINLAQKEIEQASTKTVKTTKTKEVSKTSQKISTSGITDPTTLALIEQYNAALDETTDNTQALAKAEEEYKTLQRETIKNEFDNIQSDYDRITNIIDKKKQAVQDVIDLATAQGKGMSNQYYEKQITLNNQAIKKNNAERQKLITLLEKTEIGTDEWYEMRSALYDLDSETIQLTTDVQELENTIKELDWSNFDELLSMITNVADEASFLKDLFSDTQLFGDKGEITDEGLASMGLSAQNYDLYMAQADKIAQQIKELDSQYADDKYNTLYLERRQELVKAQQDSIKSAQSEKEAIIDLVEDGLDAELDALKELVDAKKEALEIEKETYDFQKKIKSQTKDVADLERQITALETDDSDENKKKLRELKSELESAKETLEETLYDKSLSEQENALDQLVDQSEQANENYLKDSEKVFADALVKINANTQVIGNQIETIAKKVGYDVSTYISDAWVNSTTAVSNYSEKFTETSSLVIAQIGQIATQWQTAIDKANEYAQASLAASADQQADYSSTTGSTTTSGTAKTEFGSDNWVERFIKNNAVESTKNDKTYKSAYGALNEYLYENNNKYVLKLADEQDLATKLGYSPDKYSNWRKKVVEYLKNNVSFASGGIIDASAIKSTGEDGVALVRHKEAILTVDQTKMFSRFIDSLPVFDQLAESLTKPNISNISNSNSNPTYNITSQINVDGVATNEIVKNMESVATKQAENVIAKINRTSYSKGIRK